MKFLHRISGFLYLRRVARDVRRIADALERAYPPPVPVVDDAEVVIDSYEAESKTESDDLFGPDGAEIL
jgi:hypothetical protein